MMIIRNIIKFPLLLIIVFGLIYSDLSFSQTIKVGFGQDKAPFVIGRDKKGIEVDIFREALKYKGHNIEVFHLPNKRLQYALKSSIYSDIDAVATVRKTSEDGLFYVDDFIYFNNFAISKKKDNLKIEKISDLKGLSIIAWQNAYLDLGYEFESLFKPEPSLSYKELYREDTHQDRQNMLFWKGRAEVLIVDKTIFGWYRNQLKDKMNTNQEVVFHPIFSGRTYFQTAFKDKNLAVDFHDGLKFIKRTGLYDSLYKKYTDFN